MPSHERVTKLLANLLVVRRENDEDRRLFRSRPRLVCRPRRKRHWHADQDEQNECKNDSTCGQDRFTVRAPCEFRARTTLLLERSPISSRSMLVMSSSQPTQSDRESSGSPSRLLQCRRVESTEVHRRLRRLARRNRERGRVDAASAPATQRRRQASSHRRLPPSCCSRWLRDTSRPSLPPDRT